MSLPQFPTGTLPVAQGVGLFYADSGPVVDSEDYTTLIFFHGNSFNGNIFHKLLPLAASRSVRIVSVNRRGYAGSTGYTDAEIDDIVHGRPIALERIGQQVAQFLLEFAREKDIPKICANRKSGGLVVIGYSIGVVTVLTLLGQHEAVSEEMREALTPYMRELILYDPPHVAFGYEKPQDPDMYDPWADPSYKAREELYDNSSYWLSSYYDHPPLSVSDKTPNLDYRKRTSEPPGPSIITNMTPEQLSANREIAAALRSEFPMFVEPMQSLLRAQTKQALFRDPEMVFPLVKVVYLWGLRSPWQCWWGCARLKEEHEGAGRKGRDIEFVGMERANHFAHWDEPAAFLSALLA